MSLRFQKWLSFLILPAAFMITVLPAVAQQEIGVRVQVNRMPQGTYPTKLYQFNNTPGLVMVTLTNRTQSAFTIYLNGMLTGDNGVQITTAKGYQPGTIDLKPLEIKTLNAIEAGNLFDPNYLVYLSGSSSVRASVFGEQGLPEGTYQVCVRAFNTATRKPLSEEDPMGCSNVFSVRTLEPPMILNPFNEASIPFAPVQNVPLRWTTPPGAPPNTEYRVRIVEVPGNKNPNDAMFSTAVPFFETTVMGTPLLLYSMQYPLLKEGGSYAMMVTANDPMGGATFRNLGRSEVILFTYRSMTDLEIAQQPQPPTNVEYANKTLTGRLQWAFKKSEQASHNLYIAGSGGVDPGVITTDVKGVGAVNGLDITAKPGNGAAITINPGLSVTAFGNVVGGSTANGLIQQASVTPLISMNALSAVNTDPTLIAYDKALSKYGSGIADVYAKPSMPASAFSASYSSSTETSYESIAVDSATERYPLANVNFTLSAQPVTGNANKLLATGKTDQEGTFSIQFLDPSYQDTKQFKQFILSVQTDDFENTSFIIPLSVFTNNDAVDIGKFLLLAKTYRFYTKVTYEKNDEQASSQGYGVHVYRDISELDARPYLLNEGQVTGSKKNIITIDGRRVVEIAADSFTNSAGTNLGVLRTISSFDTRGAGRIFYGGKIYVKIIPSSASYYPVSSEVNVMNYSVSSSQVLQAKAIYALKTKPAHIEGTVALFLAGQSSIPIKGATVRVMYSKSDVVSESPYGNLWETPLDASVAGKANGSYLNAINGYTTTNPGITSMQNVALSASMTVQTPAVLVGSGANGKLVAQTAIENSLFETVNPVPDGFKAITTTTDELGKYYAGMPVLKPGAKVTVEVIKVPYEFSTFNIRARRDNKNPTITTLGQGVSQQIDFTIDADVADVVGRVVDADGKSLANVRLNFKGNTLTSTGPDGIFQFKIYPGDHTISLEKEGFVIKTTVIHIPQVTGNTGDRNRYESDWINMTVLQKQLATLDRIQTSPTIQASIARGNTFNAAMFGIAADNKGELTAATQYNASLAVAFGMAVDQQTPQYEVPRQFAIDVRDIGYLVRITGKVRFRIVDEASNQPIPNTKISLFDTSHVTDPAGEWYYEGFGGACTITLAPPSSSGCAAEQRSFVLAETGVEQVVTIALKKGVKISGTVTSGSSALGAARILVDDKDFMSITTDGLGNYTLFTTPGEHTIGARKQNYVGEDKSQVIAAPGATINFNLKGGNGRNYGSLLGFAVELSSSITVSATQEKWSGAFVNLHPVNGSVFGISGDIRIPFTDVVVNFSGANASPQGDVVRTDMTELPMKLFGYLPVKLQGSDVVTFTKASDGSGQLSGKIKVDFNAINGYRGWNMDDIAVLLAKTGSAAPENIVVFSSGTAPAIPNSFTMVASAGQISGKLYGFSFTVNNTTLIDNDGVEIGGTISTPALGVIKPMNIGLTRLFINRALVIGAVQVQADNLPSLEIASWKAAISTLIFNEDGFKLGGNIAVEIPKSGTSQVSFSDLSIAKDGMFGGSFTIPGAGINILNVANLSTDGDPLSFGRVGNSSVYRIGGKASLQINVGILSKAFKVPLFEIMTNGDFSVEVPVNYSTSLGPFGFTVNNVFINTADNSPYIGVQGAIKADFDILKFEVANIKVRASASGPSYSIEKLGVKLDIPVVKTEAYVTFKDDGFEGNGTLSVPGTPIAGSISFKYYKHSYGVELGAHFFTNIPPIPIGVLVTLDGVGGGFDYVSGGPNGGFKIDIQCALSFLGTGPVVALKPLGISVASAGILTGYGDVVIGTYLTMGHASVEFNGPERTFAVRIDAQMEPIEGLMKQSVQGLLLISAKPNDEFAFLGAAVQVKLLNLIDNYGEMGIGIRVKNAKTRGGEISHFFEHAPEEYIGERFSGVYIDVGVHLGIPKAHPLEFDLFIASAKIWCETNFTAGLLLNLENMAFRIRFGGKFDAGIEGCVADIACVGISANLCYLVEGGRNPSMGWNFSATASGNASLSAGIGIGDCDPGCNEIVTVWDGCVGGAFKICGGASLDFRFSERDGLKFNVRAGSSVPDCF